MLIAIMIIDMFVEKIRFKFILTGVFNKINLFMIFLTELEEKIL